MVFSKRDAYHLRLIRGRTLTTWKDYFQNPQGGKLGLFNAIQTIGGLVSIMFSPYVCDWLGRRHTLILGISCESS